MNVRVLFFGATADETETRSLEVSLSEGSNAHQAFIEILNHFPSLKNHRLLFAVNQEYVSGAQKLSEGDELAIFTAVSGG